MSRNAKLQLLALALVGSTVATMLATVGVFLGVKRLLGAGAEPAA